MDEQQERYARGLDSMIDAVVEGQNTKPIDEAVRIEISAESIADSINHQYVVIMLAIAVDRLAMQKVHDGPQ